MKTLKMFYLIFFVLLFCSNNKVNSQQSKSLEENYQQCFAFSNLKDQNYWWDMKLSGNYAGNLQGYSTNRFTLNDNQIWLIMPIYPGSKEYLITSLYNGGIVDVNSHNNMYVYNGFHHGGNNQIFRLDEDPNKPGSLNIICKSNLKVADLCQSSRNKDPFIQPSRAKNNIYAGDYANVDNQRWHMYAVESILNCWWGYYPKMNITIPEPPAPLGYNGDNIPQETAETFLGSTIVPFTLVNIGIPRAIQVKTSPYYKLEHYQLWQFLYKQELPANHLTVYKATITIGVKTIRSLEETFGSTFSSSGEWISSDKSMTFKNNLENSLQIKVTELTETNTSKTEEYTETWSPTIRTYAVTYQLVDRYKLFSWIDDKSPSLNWDVIYNSRYNTFKTYPADQVKSLKEAKGIIKTSSSAKKSAYIGSLQDFQSSGNNEKDVTIYPNPATNQLNMILPEENCQIIITTISGAILKTLKSQGKNFKLDCTILKDGTYIIKIIASKTMTSRIIQILR